MKKALAFLLCLVLVTGIAALAFADVDKEEYQAVLLKDVKPQDLVTSNETIALGAATALLDYMLATNQTDLLDTLDFTGTLKIRYWDSYLDYYYPTKANPTICMNLFVCPTAEKSNYRYGDAAFSNNPPYEKVVYECSMADVLVQLQALVNKLKK